MGLLPGYHVIFHTFYIFKIPPQIWRVPTSFLLTGSGLGLVFDTYFLYRYLSELEVSNRRFPRKEDLVWYLFCVSAGILVSLPASSPRALFLCIPLPAIFRLGTTHTPRRNTLSPSSTARIASPHSCDGSRKEEDHPCMRATYISQNVWTRV